MKSRVLACMFVAILFFPLAAIAVACGGGDKLTLEEYFHQLDSLDEDADDRLDSVITEFREEMLSIASVEEEVQVIRDFWVASAPIADDFLDDINDLQPPAEAEGAHKEFVEAGKEMLEALQDFISQLDEVESQADLDDLRQYGPLTEAEEHSERTCFALQGIADANNIDVDLECQE